MQSTRRDQCGRRWFEVGDDSSLHLGSLLVVDSNVIDTRGCRRVTLDPTRPCHLIGKTIFSGGEDTFGGCSLCPIQLMMSDLDQQ